MLEISSDDIASLGDEDLRSLVGQLCEAELRAQGLPASGAIWSGDQNAADGGIDVRVAAERGVGGFLPRANTGFQVKKTDFTPGLIGPEMRPSGDLRPSIATLVLQGGAYIIVSSGANTSDSALKHRLDAMRKATSIDDPMGALHLDFYDRGRLATWVRSHPGLMLWVRKRIGRSVSGWKSYEAWAVSPDGVADVYLSDEKTRLHAGTIDEKGIAITDGIQRMRDALRQSGSVVRLAGLSGVGKTRLVQALFDARLGEASLDPALAVYTDMNDNPEPQPSGMVHDLIAARKRAIVVVDNCAPDLHRRLTEIARTFGSTVSVITVEYDIQEDEPEGTEAFRLEPSTPKLVEELFKRRFPEMSRVDASTVAEFSGGNARIALALANTLERHETLAGLKDEELFKRLFYQRQARDSSLLDAAQACALVYSFQGETLSGSDAELPVLAELAGMSAQQLYAKVAELKQRDLVQRRSVWRAVLPHAIANRLAVMALKAIPLELIESKLTTERLLRSFSRRIGYLHESQEAARVVENWLGTGGYLENVASLNELGLAMFNNIAPVSPPATLAAIERALAGPRGQNMGDERSGRDRAGSLLRSLAYESDLFERAVAGLLVLFDAETSDKLNQTVIQDLIIGMFHLILSGTHASAGQRARIVEAQLRSSDTPRQALGVKLLDAMLRTGQFSSGHSFEFGARSRDFGYWPSNQGEMEDWYLAALNTASSIALSDLPVSKAVRSEVAGALRGLWFVSSAIQDRLEQLARALLTNEYWQEGWIAVRTVLSFPNEKADQTAVERLRTLENVLRPKSVAEQIRAVVLSQAWGRLDYADMDEGDEREDESPTAAYERANAVAEGLGKKCAQDDALLITLLPDLVRGSGGRLTAFGKGLAHGTPNRADVWSQLHKALAATREGECNAATICGFLLGLHSDDPALCETLLDAALEDDTLGAWFPVLQTTVPVSTRGVARLKRSVTRGKAPIEQFRFIGWSRPSGAISGADFKELLMAIAVKPEGYVIAIDILSMRLHSDKNIEAAHPPELIEVGRELLSQAQFHDRDNMHEYRLRMIVNACLPGKDGERAARDICLRFKAALANHSVYAFRFDQLVEGLFKAQPLVALDVFFGGPTENGEEVIEVNSFDDPSDRRKNPLDAVSDDEILEWCSQGGQQRYLAMSQAITFYDAPKDAPLGWSSIALKLLDTAPDPIPVLDVFIERFSPRMWSGSRAAIVESRLHLLDKFECHPNAAIAALVANKRPELQMEVARTREWETKHDRERDEKFE